MPDMSCDEMVRVYLRRTMGLWGWLQVVVCGVYRMRSSNGGKVDRKGEMEGVVCSEFGGKQSRKRWEGRLVVSVGEGGELKGRGGGLVVFKAETWMWVKKGDGSMPLEGWLMSRVHEITSWWLMWKGTEYMKELGEKDKKVF